METTIAWTTRMKTTDTSAMTESATLRTSSLARRTNRGDGPNVFPRNGFATVIPIVLTAPMKTQPCTTVRPRSPAQMTSSHARTAAASTKDGPVTTTTTAVTAPTKASSATLSTKRARVRNSPARTSNVFAISTDAVSASN